MEKNAIVFIFLSIGSVAYLISSILRDDDAKSEHDLTRSAIFNAAALLSILL